MLETLQQITFKLNTYGGKNYATNKPKMLYLHLWFFELM